ncbi:hypothetical protein EB796_012114 [Bugula neritina]|uniref:LEM domain-containing protein n=1 Tax=Bugula neritina TaxID=10212 RepID=A0A7J7JUE4_BUGNE|nr:hypothetical protein EB796_012114 [Bugula neritina]
MDYDSLTDEEIREKLVNAGIPCGPIIESTRKVYIRKLKRLAGEIPDLNVEPVNGTDEDASDEEPRPSPTRIPRPKTATTRTPPSSAGDAGDVRQRRVQQKKLDVPISKTIEAPSDGGICGGLFIKLVIFCVLCIILAVVLGSLVK